MGDMLGVSYSSSPFPHSRSPKNKNTTQPLEFALSASIGATLVVAVVSFRLYITWK